MPKSMYLVDYKNVSLCSLFLVLASYFNVNFTVKIIGRVYLSDLPWWREYGWFVDALSVQRIDSPCSPKVPRTVVEGIQPQPLRTVPAPLHNRKKTKVSVKFTLCKYVDRRLIWIILFFLNDLIHFWVS